MKRQEEDYIYYLITNREQLTKQINYWIDKFDRLQQENEQLKKLLLRCKPYLSEWIVPMDILAEIDKIEGNNEDKTEYL